MSAALVEALPDTRIKELHDGLVIYDTDARPAKIKNLPFFNNSFSLIYKFHSAGEQPLEQAIKRIFHAGKLSTKVHLQESEHKRSFRVITSQENQLVSVDTRLLQGLENEIKNELKLELNRRQSDYEFWLLSRSEGMTLFALRLSRQSKKDKEREKGELKPQLSYLLCTLSEPQENEIFMDPFCGSGSIPLTRVQFTRKGLIVASDNDKEKVAELKEKVKELKLKERVVVREMDATDISRYEDGSIHKIVTDPPWGLFENIKDPLDLYRKTMKEFVRILKPGGILVILISNAEKMNEFFGQYNEGITLEGSYNVLVSGKKAVIYKMRKQ